MKFYATVTSERASKGQGGEWLDIRIVNERREIAAILHVSGDDGGGVMVSLIASNKATADKIRRDAIEILSKYEKGERQKGNGCKFNHAICLKDGMGRCMDKS